ncbi:MAG TPA: deoxyribodipyrimidine photo-lyase [Mycobacteriales bacterium]
MSAADSRALLWLRRDLRLADHPALLAAADGGARVLPVFVLDEQLWVRAGEPRRALLAGALADLHARTDGALRVLSGDPRTVVPAAARAAGAGRVHVSGEFTPYGRGRDEEVAGRLAAQGVEWVVSGSPYAVSPGRVVKQDGTPYRVFTPYAKAWRQHGWRAPAARPRRVDWAAYDGPHVAPMPDMPAAAGLPTPTEAAAWRTWRRFRDEHLADYARDRDAPGTDATSRLSPYLHLGLIHPRSLLADVAGRRGAGVHAWRTELCWREFYADVLFHRPESAWGNLQPRFDRLAWDDGPDARRRLGRWQRGETGFPIVDAGMRQLAAEGWMHNRVRMITASFLVKDLHLPWQWGARFFLEHLVDGDLASNNHGWQWVAGTGTDASPFVRVFSPLRQAERFDPDGEYVRRWVPELRGLPGKAALEPWNHDAPEYVQRMVDHAEERAEALRRYEAVAGDDG